MFGVPQQTLRDRVSGHVKHDIAVVGGAPILNYDEERVLVDYVETLAQLGYGLTNERLKNLAGDMVFSFGRKPNNKPMSNNWLYGFLHRWGNQIASLSAKRLESTRAKSATPEAIDIYFKNLYNTLTTYNLLDKPHLIFNMDETGITPEHRPPNIIAPVGVKAQAVTSPRSSTTTIIGCANAIGNALPPFFIFKGKRFDPALMNGAAAGASCAMSESGWINGEIFKEYLENHFLQHVNSMNANPSQHVLLIYDGHAAHVSIDTIEWAKKHNVVLFVLPAHTSHLLQPLDVGVFGPFKNYYNSECASFFTKNMGQQIARYELCTLASRAYLKSMTPANIQSAFRKSGIFPYAKDVVTIQKLFPCESFRENDPIGKVRALKGGEEAVKLFMEQQIKSTQDICTLTKACPKCKCTCRMKKGNEKDETLKKPKAGGKEITNDVYHSELTEYNKQRNKKSQKPNEGQHTINDIETEPLDIQRPSTSGENLIVHPFQDLSDFDDELDDDIACCICNRITPPTLRDQPCLKIVNWAQCDGCDGWVHLAFCTSVRVVRRNSQFFCPKCQVDLSK